MDASATYRELHGMRVSGRCPMVLVRFRLVICPAAITSELPGQQCVKESILSRNFIEGINDDYVHRNICGLNEPEAELFLNVDEDVVTAEGLVLGVATVASLRVSGYRRVTG